MKGKEKKEVLRMYFSLGMEIEEIAARLKAQPMQVCAALNDPRALKPYMEQAEAAKLRAMICVSERAEEAAKKQAELIALGEAAKEQAVSQRAAKDILDRAGIGAGAEESRDIRIVFEGMPALGMPGDRAKEEEATGHGRKA